MTFEQWLESRETDTLRHWRVAMCQWVMTVEMEAWQAGYTEGKRIQEKEHAEKILAQLTEESQQLGLYDDRTVNPMIKDQ